MDGQTLPTCAKRLALELPFTEHCWPFGPEYDVFKVGGKIFCWSRSFADVRLLT